MNTIFGINGSFPDIGVKSMQRDASVLDGENAGRLKNGDMTRDIIGTFYNYGLTVSPIRNNLLAYDDLYDLITAPVESHPVAMAFGQGLLEYNAYVANTTDELTKKLSNNRWNNLTFTVIAIEPQRYLNETWSMGSGSGSGNKVFTIDGVGFDVGVKSLKRLGAVLDTSQSGRSKAGKMSREIIGTYYNFTMDISQKVANYIEYDRLYYALTAPKDSHDIVIPYGQDTLSFKAYVSRVSDKLIKVNDQMAHWGELTVNFIAMAPARR